MTQPLLALSMPGGPELVFIFVIILLLFGAKKLPELAKGLGRSLGEFKKARDEFEREIHKSTTEVKEDPNKQLHAPDSTGLPAPTPKAPDQEVAK